MSPAQKFLFNDLTDFQQALATEILAGTPPLEAYRIAHPDSTSKDRTARVTVSRTTRHPKVKLFMDAMKESLLSDAIMDREEALEVLSVFARGNFGTMVDFKNVEVGKDSDGDAVIQSVWKIKDSALMDPKQLAAIAELSATSQGLKMKLHNPVQAIQQLAAMNGKVSTVISLIKAGAKVTANSNCALRSAVKYGKLNTIKV